MEPAWEICSREEMKMQVDVKNEDHVLKKDFSAFWGFLEHSSVYALSQIGHSTSHIRRIVWMSVLILGLAGFSYQIYTFFQLYFQYPVIITLEVERMKTLPFPAVTVCNLNRIKSYPGLKNDSNSPSHYIWFPHGYTSIFDEGIIYTPAITSDMIHFGDEVFREKQRNVEFSQEYFNLDAEFRKNYGHQAENFITSCTFDGIPCDASNFTLFQSFQYGNCYTFSGSDEDVKKTVLGKGVLELELDLEIDDYLPLTSVTGAHVMIHEGHKNLSTEDSGVNISPGYETAIGLEQIQAKRLPAPYRDKCRNDEDGQYDQNACLNSCIQDNIRSLCSCIVGPTLASESGAPRCNFSNLLESQCMDQVLERATIQYCNCPLPCLSVDFHMTLSSAIWPTQIYFEQWLKQSTASSKTMDKSWNSANFTTNAFKGILNNTEVMIALKTVIKNDITVNRVNTILRKITPPSLEDVRDRYAKLKVFFRLLDVTTYVQEPMYQDSEFFSQLGGQMGLWLGMSIIALFEMVEGILNLCTYLLRKKSKK